MGTTIENNMDLAIAVTAQNNWLAGNCCCDVIARLRHLARVTYKQPYAAENAFHLHFENFRVDIEVTMNPVGFYKFAQAVGIEWRHYQYLMF